MAAADIETYLAALPSELQGICKKLHAIARSQMPDAHAMIYHGAIGYSTSQSPFDRFVYIAPQRHWVNLGFFFGADIPDPQRLLIGDGKRMRHIKISNEQQVHNPAIKSILRAAWKKAPDDIAKIHPRKEKKHKE